MLIFDLLTLVHILFFPFDLKVYNGTLCPRGGIWCKGFVLFCLGVGWQSATPTDLPVSVLKALVL